MRKRITWGRHFEKSRHTYVIHFIYTLIRFIAITQLAQIWKVSNLFHFGRARGNGTIVQQTYRTWKRKVSRTNEVGWPPSPSPPSTTPSSPFIVLKMSMIDPSLHDDNTAPNFTRVASVRVFIQEESHVDASSKSKHRKPLTQWGPLTHWPIGARYFEQ